jgi:Tfp pilus tip-associated adhesin PilY1
LQEDIERRTVAISISAARLTSRVLARVLTAVAHKIHKEYQKGQTPHGRQSVKKLMSHGTATNSIALDGDTKLFDRMARKYNVDYAFHKTGPGRYLLFFKANQADAITACFSEYSSRVMERGTARPSILRQLQNFTNLVKSRGREPQQLERTREAGTHER